MLNADYRPLSYYPAVDLVLAGRDQGGVPRSGEHRLRIRQDGAKSELRDAAALRGLPEDLRQAVAPPGLHPLQRLPARPLHLPVLRRPRGPDLRPPGPPLQGRATTWENVVAACSPCNLARATACRARSKMWPRQKPFAPTCTTCTATAGSSRRTTCTRAGSTTSTGTPSWSRSRGSVRRLRAPARLRSRRARARSARSSRPATGRGSARRPPCS